MNTQELSSSDIQEFQRIGQGALQIAREVHDRLGYAGAEHTGDTNQYGDTQIKVDPAVEIAVREFLRDSDRVWYVRSEEFPPENTRPGHEPEGIFVMDGMDGSEAARAFLLGDKSVPNRDRYATMVAVGPGEKINYDGFVYAGINEHAKDRIIYATKGQGAFMQTADGLSVPLHTTVTEELNEGTPIFAFDGPLFQRFNTDPAILTRLDEKRIPRSKLLSSASHWVDLASGATVPITLPTGETVSRPLAAVVETSRKGMEEWPIANRLARESGFSLRTRPHDRRRPVDLGELSFLKWQQQIPGRQQIRGRVIVGAPSQNVADKLLSR